MTIGKKYAKRAETLGGAIPETKAKRYVWFAAILARNGTYCEIYKEGISLA
jgi:hypothetical protein